MSSWRYYVQPIAGPQAGSIRSELNLSSHTIRRRLKATSTMSASISCRDPQATAQNLDTENTLLVAERDDVVRFAGPLRGADLAADGDTIALRAVGAWELIVKRFVRSSAGMTHGELVKSGTVRWSAVEQFAIVADLIDHMQSVAGGDLDVVVEYTAPSGVERDRTVEAGKGKSIGGLIEQLADVEQGFDWQLEPRGNAGSLELVLRLDHPRRGRETGYRFDFDDFDDGLADGSSNVLGAGYADSSDELVTHYVGVGAGEGAAQLTATSADPSTIGRLPLLESSGQWADVSQAGTLKAHVDRERRVNAQSSRIPRLRVDPDAFPRLGYYILGDVVSSRVRRGYFVDTDGRYRILATSETREDTGAEYVDLELADLARYAA